MLILERMLGVVIMLYTHETVEEDLRICEECCLLEIQLDMYTYIIEEAIEEHVSPEQLHELEDEYNSLWEAYLRDCYIHEPWFTGEE